MLKNLSSNYLREVLAFGISILIRDNLKYLVINHWIMMMKVRREIIRILKSRLRFVWHYFKIFPRQYGVKYTL